jgi:hypothetical protein
MHSNDLGSTANTASEATPPAQEPMHELTALELQAIGGGRTRCATPDLIVVIPPRDQH